MALLNPPEILPPLLRAVVEAAHLAGKPVDDTRLIELLSPGGLEEPGSIGVQEKRHVVHTHTAARELGLLKATDGGSVPSPAAQEAMKRGSLRENWIEVLRQSVLKHETARNGVAEAANEDTRGVKDLVFALTWFSAQDALAEPMSWDGKNGYRGFQALQNRDFGDVTTRFPVQNDTRFGAFERWSLHLGFAKVDELGARALRPLPVDIVRDTVATFEPEVYEIDAFCRRLGDALPCLWPGEGRKQLVEVIGSDPDPDVTAGGIDSSVAVSLLVLEAEERLRLSELADAPQPRVIAPLADQPRTITHVEVRA